MWVDRDGGVTPGRRKRRSWRRDEKLRIVNESLEQGASIAAVARQHALNANQLFAWRRQFGVEPAMPKDIAPMLPVTITPEATSERSDPRSSGHMEIVLAEGDRIIVFADVETVALTRVLKALKASR
jgi:transposase